MDYSSLVESIVAGLLDEGLRNELKAIGLSDNDLKTIGNIRREVSRRVGDKVHVTSKNILVPTAASTKGSRAFAAKHKEGLKDALGYIDPDSPRSINVNINPLEINARATIYGLNPRDAAMDQIGHEFSHHLTDKQRRDKMGDTGANEAHRQIMINDDDQLKDEGQTWRAFKDLTKDLGLPEPKSSSVKQGMDTYVKYRR